MRPISGTLHRSFSCRQIMRHHRQRRLHSRLCNQKAAAGYRSPRWQATKRAPFEAPLTEAACYHENASPKAFFSHFIKITDPGNVPSKVEHLFLLILPNQLRKCIIHEFGFGFQTSQRHSPFNKSFVDIHTGFHRHRKQKFMCPVKFGVQCPATPFPSSLPPPTAFPNRGQLFHQLGLFSGKIVGLRTVPGQIV